MAGGRGVGGTSIEGERVRVLVGEVGEESGDGGLVGILLCRLVAMSTCLLFL